ncbi:hypothetical protein GCM10010168_25540 [Actinoplanes ianthinogenes]|uniref:Uncharacterized protein n=1 Tax=Actinoplanes ianthinogenes TaxID=122358 RepID=A0ABN6CTX5_9ACTN|nr:hypothetical protein [Actinoplanes ianthinogenes]BCJ48194.1 hypothetical protein Aiant_88510 [Actinoplanes ianthinogenes]GGR07076.1 hypothetical protein GCM10010168_25540 [Actinoplanes ianthinogenes]
MPWWGRAECPVRQVEQEWIETQLDWLVAEFGTGRLRGTVVLPTDGFFPGSYRADRADIRSVLSRLCAHMGIDPARIELEHYAGDQEPGLSAHVPMNWRSRGAAGHHRVRDGRSVIGIRDDQAAAPMALVATIGHELGHVLLLADGRISAGREDHEPLTDLLTVFFGLGIFTANAAFEYSRTSTSYRTSRLGYLTEPMYGYALARYAWLRGEPHPPWARYLDTNPRTFLKRGLRYLAQA